MQLLIPAKSPQCPAHMCGTLCTHLAARQTPPLATANWCFKHTCMLVPPQQHREELERTSRSVTHWCSGRSTSSQYLVCNRDSRSMWGSELGSELWTAWDPWQSRRGTRALGTEAEIWGLCRNEDNLLLGIPHPQHSLSLNKLWWKECLLWLSMERFPGMLDCGSGMYRLNGPIWKLTEMKREPYGHITNGI